MDDQQALAIVTALANGADPRTGEVFPADSPYQSPDVIRALFAAQRALEARMRPPARAQRTGATTSQPSSGGVTGHATPNKPNAGKPWSAEEDKQLLASFDGGKPLADIAREHGRTTGGVRARLEKHGRLEPSPATRWPVKDATRQTTGYAATPAERSGGANGRSMREYS